MDGKRSMHRRIVASATLLVAAMCAALALPARAADPAKTLRVVFSIAETSFDPQFASDAASDSVISNIFEQMLDYDYLARPVKLVPRTLEAMPTVSDGGKTYLFKIRKGIFFTPDPAFKGKPRELTAADQVYGLKRLLDPDGEESLGVADRRQDRRHRRSAREGREDGQARLRRADRGARGRRSLHAADPPQGARPALPLRARGAEHDGRRARGRRGVRTRFRRPSGRHGPLHAGRVQAQLEDHARRESRLPRGDLHAGGADPPRIAADRRGAQGQAPADSRPHRDHA